jgi:hypothetical protein
VWCDLLQSLLLCQKAVPQHSCITPHDGREAPKGLVLGTRVGVLDKHLCHAAANGHQQGM